jgi:molybdate transport system substrate-binding protein
LIATGEVTSVPVGIYAKEALQKLGAWQAAAPKLLMTHHVRAALTLVAVGETQLGIVYSTDAKVSPNVRTIGTFPAASHSPIVYSVAATVTAKPEAVGYIAYLCSKAAKAIFEQYGFRFLIRPTS